MSKQTINNLESAGTIRVKLNDNFAEVYDTLAEKVDKVEGKALSTNDFDAEAVGELAAAYDHSQTSHMKVAASDATASVDNVGACRYRAEANSSHVEVCVQTGTDTYAWEAIITKTW